ncbi:MAG: arylsulfatase family protein, partial [Akkermansiaceae bacterium]|nr:arylsulfatase family protein [Akkermansiaceae bacterium]
QKDRYDQMMAIYASVIERMDRAVGEVVDGLKQRGQLDNTLILFLSDNGGNAETGVQGRSVGEHPGDPFSDVFIGQCWATLNNTPFTRYKHYTDEGGIATPLIAHWPKVISGDRLGTLEKQPGHIIDLLATFTDVAKAEYPKEYHGHAITPLEGTSLLPAFTGQDLHRTQPIFWEHEGNRAVRDGDLKLVALENQPWRLYDLAADRSEQHDLAAERPDAVTALSAKWDGWAARANVLPLGAWRGERAENAAAPASNKTSFVLAKNDHLDRAEAPAIAKRGFTITADFEATADDGVIVAQGGAARGYSLSVDEGKLTFFVHDGAGSAKAVLPTSLRPGKKSTALARLASDGALSLSLDGGEEVTAKATGPLSAVPLDGLDIGKDTGAPVGPYQSAATFKGEIPRVKIEVNLK